MGVNFGVWLIEHELLDGPGADSCELVGVCDLDLDKARAVGERFGVPAYNNYDAVLADPSVDAVVLMVGPAGRAALVEQAVLAGKPVMTTKPFETSSADAERALSAAASVGIPVFMNSPAPTPSADIRVIEEWITAYDLGRPVGYRASTWCSYRETADGSWYDDPLRAPVAPITRLGVYLLADVCRLMPPIAQVQVAESRLFTGRPTSDNAVVLVTHTDGTLGTVFSSFCIDDGQPYQLSLELNYERGTIYRSVGPATLGEVELNLSAMVAGVRVVEHRTVARESGYQWDTFRRACRGEDVGPVVAPEAIVQLVSVFEKIRQLG